MQGLPEEYTYYIFYVHVQYMCMYVYVCVFVCINQYGLALKSSLLCFLILHLISALMFFSV